MGSLKYLFFTLWPVIDLYTEMYFPLNRGLNCILLYNYILLNISSLIMSEPLTFMLWISISFQLLAAHAQELEDLERKVGVEQNRQRVALRDRLAARRQRKINAQKSRQDIEKQKEIIEQKKELAQVKAKTVSVLIYTFTHEHVLLVSFSRCMILQWS